MWFMFSRRWALFLLFVGLLAWGTNWLGNWQFRELTYKHHDNHRIQANLAAPPVPAASLLQVGVAHNDSIEWRRVTIHGQWDNAHTVVVKYQTDINGNPGVDVVTPLVTASGAAVLVDRGWMATPNTGDSPDNTPAPSAGEVTVTGWVRVNGTGDSAKIANGQTRAVSAQTFAKTVSYPVYGNPVDMQTQTPLPTTALGQVEMPDDTGDGPYFFYGLQWWFFGILAVFGFFYLAYDEWQRVHRPARPRPEGAEPPKPPKPRLTMQQRLQHLGSTAIDRDEDPRDVGRAPAEEERSG